MVKKKNKKKMLVENNWNSKKGWGIPCNSKIICFGVIVAIGWIFIEKNYLCYYCKELCGLLQKKIDYEKYSPFEETWKELWNS